jgi:hypothetical protein
MYINIVLHVSEAMEKPPFLMVLFGLKISRFL